ncbi:Pkinase Tyr, ANF receptor and/or Peripla BP 6 domain containing protein [Asbolus verrucosus]|uniref:Gamma-aminobutyric acid type B receptor subunit 2 n=1 Tax=Asbolus verrucosus TaxID=1661398 RepID=A0A482VN66_ASBVE|nr:Pkinase Tyr, ANF receptor and/or Peripla BP 6 domain containing protein [Asbolus verrucosus]
MSVTLTRLSPSIFFYCWCLAVVPFVLSSDSKKCLVDTPEVIPKKYVHYMDHQFDVTLLTSDRPLHRLSTEIFKIIMEEVVGFSKVVIVEGVDDFEVKKVVENLASDEKEFFPRALIDLEVWVPSGYDLLYWEDTQLVKDFGNLAVHGRFGWFIPADMDGPVKNYYKKWENDIKEMYWTFLKDRKIMQIFDVGYEHMGIITQNARINGSSHYACTDDECTNGIYVPKQCESGLSCALLLTSSFNSTKFVIDHINELNLFVKVVWLGKNLRQTVETLTEIYKSSSLNKSLLILHYTPSDLILREKNYISVIFPQCEHLNSTRSMGCKYELNRVVKMAWNKIEALDLLQPVRSFKFNEREYDYLLTLYENARNRSDLRQIGCQWIRDKKSTWSMWNFGGDTNTIYIGGIFPISGSSYNGKGIVKGALLARDAINNNSHILKNYNLKLVIENGKCRPDSVMKVFIDYVVNTYYNKLIGVLGPACSDTVEPLAGVSKHYRMMVISYSAEGASFSDREKYPYFFRTIGENKHYKHVYLHFFKKLGWKRVAALTEDGQKYTEYISHMQELLEENHITFISNTKFPRERDTFQMTRYLEDLKRKTARIIILDVFDEIARIVMCEAYHLKMTSTDGYVWFLPAWLNRTWYDTDHFNQFRQESVNCTTSEMIRAVTGYFSMAHSFFAPDNATVQGNVTVAEWKSKYKEVKPYSEYSNYAGYAYDAVWTYALALDKLVKNDPEAVSDLHSENTTNKLVRLIKDTDFYGVSGRIKFRGGPSRFSTINLMEWYNNKSHIVGRFNPNLTDDQPDILDGELILNMSAVRWFTPNRAKPDDGTVPPPICALESMSKFLNVTCEMAIVILNIILVCLLVLVVVAAIYNMKKRYDRKVRYTEKYMRHFGIDLRLNPSQITDLDKWEIPRNSVVINRKLGEGAFGTVYGGEANFPEKGWVAVAVKTLKVGSSTEEKLDFLSEAEVMKRFEHKNIIKLLGVCTKQEPIYTIMEYMLYGDLKTFLLARRHLVNDKTIEESDEISSKKLTMMALDVARGLSYLAQLKYVHRDVASRNCLINAQRTVKLGDFGMTRPMFENDYYKFTRKGMLPVRWMSPESLALGVFTPASDVWSFGILLYEIVTFGSFPYQGMNNMEVLEYVKAGHTIVIPQGVKTQLRGLLKSCWHQDPKMRTRASEIVEFLANNPRLIVPCLDVPLASVQLEDTNQLEINLPDQFRKCSSSNIKASPTIPNGISTPHSLDTKSETQRHDSISDSGVTIPLEDCCPREPLLGPAKSSSSLLNFGKYVTIQHHNDGNVQNDDDYLAHNSAPVNGYVVSKV